MTHAPTDLPEWMDLLYPELHALAERYLGFERANHTLQPTALVNEAYLRLEKQHTPFVNQDHFRALAATMMRRVLLDHARGRQARGGDAEQLLVSYQEAAEGSRPRAIELLDLDAALTRLAETSLRQSRIVEMRFFGGSNLQEIADVLGVSRRTVDKDWAYARAWLHQELEGRTVDPDRPRGDAS